jgi:hypothetical protein
MTNPTLTPQIEKPASREGGAGEWEVTDQSPGDEGVIGLRMCESDWSVNSSCGRHSGAAGAGPCGPGFGT